jgi:hypothetical protein
MSELSVEVEEGLAELKSAFEGCVSHEPDGAGGAYVTIEKIDLGKNWSAASAPISFHIPYNYPAAEIYPYYLPAAIGPRGAWPGALQRIRWRDQEVVQVSLRHSNWDPERDRVLGSVTQACLWLKSQ